MWFTSDNAGPAHPAVLAALARANDGLRRLLRRRRGDGAGDRAAARGLRGARGGGLSGRRPAPRRTRWRSPASARPGPRSIATATPMSQEDECGAPEFYTGGAKLTLLDGAHGRIDPASLARGAGRAGAASVHNVQHGALSADQRHRGGRGLRARRGARARRASRARTGMPVHMDGARFANALVALGCTPGRADLEGRRRRAELRRHQERLPRGRGGDPVRPRPRLGVRAAPQARRASRSPSTATCRRRWRPISTDDLWLELARAGQRPRRAAVARARGAARRAARAPDRGQRRLRRLAARRPPRGAGGGRALLPLAGATRPSTARTTSRVGAARLQLGDHRGRGRRVSRRPGRRESRVTRIRRRTGRGPATRAVTVPRNGAGQRDERGKLRQGVTTLPRLTLRLRRMPGPTECARSASVGISAPQSANR